MPFTKTLSHLYFIDRDFFSGKAFSSKLVFFLSTRQIYVTTFTSSKAYTFYQRKKTEFFLEFPIKLFAFYLVKSKPLVPTCWRKEEI